MPLPQTTSQLDPATGYQIPTNSGTWANASTWGSFTSWISKPSTSIVVVTNIIDRGTESYFNIKTTADFTGNISYSVFTSNTGEFQGEEIETIFTPYTTNVSAFYGRYFAVCANVSSTSGQCELRSLGIAHTNNTFDIHYNSLNSSTLNGVTSNRYLPLPRTIGALKTINVTAHDPTVTEAYYMLTGETGYIVDYNGTVSSRLAKNLLSGDYTAQYVAMSRYQPNPNRISIYETFDGVEFNEIVQLNPSGINQNSIRWSHDGTYLASVNDSNFSIWTRSVDSFTSLLSNSSVSSGTVCAWSKSDNTWVAQGQASSPWVRIYKAGGGTYAVQSHPSTGVDLGSVYCMEWDPTDTYLAVGHGNNPGLTIYKRNGNSFTSLTTIPSYIAPVFSLSWTPDGNRLAVGLYQGGTEQVIYILYRSGDTFVEVPNPYNPSVDQGNKVTGLSYNTSGNALAICWNGTSLSSDTRFIGIYRVNGNTHTWANTQIKSTNPAWDISWNSNNQQIYVAQGQNHPWLLSAYPIQANINYGIEIFDFTYSGNVLSRVTNTGILAGNITQVAAITTASNGYVRVDSTASFPAVGSLRVDQETISYTSKTANTFYGLSRGVTNSLFTTSTRSFHSNRSLVFDVANVTVQSYFDVQAVGIVFPYITNKDRLTPGVTFRNGQGDYVGATFDATITVYPEQYMDASDLNYR